MGAGGGGIAAAAQTYLPHDRFSPCQSHAWGGLVAVSDDPRGKGLGTFVNALMVVSAFRDLGTTHGHEPVSANNQPSRRMVAACGHGPAPHLIRGIPAPDETARFTR